MNERKLFKEHEIYKWISEQCIPFAVALKEIFPYYELAALNNIHDIDDDEEVYYNYDFVHAFCYHPNDYKIVIDAFGVRTLNDLYNQFYDIDPEIDWDIPNAQYLIDNYSGKDFYLESSFEYDHEEYLEALEWIKKYKDIYFVPKNL